MLDLQTQTQITLGFLSVFSIVGVIGNALVLYVFSRFKQKLTSTIFILTLAGTDFITCFVTIPFTIVSEYLGFDLKYDIVCQIYTFLVTTTVPFSAFVMSAIAVDRYLCIVHPFKHAMTIKRAEFIVGFLCIFAVILGILCSAQHEIIQSLVENQDANSSNIMNISGTPDVSLAPNATMNVTESSLYSNLSTALPYKVVYMCGPRMTPFFHIFQKIYSSFFAICALIVIVLYSLIYRSVLARRRKKFKIVQNRCCGFGASLPSECETEFSTLNNEVGKETGEDGKKENKKYDKAVQKNGSSSVSDRDVIMKPGGVSRAKLEKMRMANIKTAFMLSIVALVFIVAFLPSWLVALRAIEMNIIIFNIYFIYNVVNPIIYAFFNGTFRNHLKQLLPCKK